MTRSGTARVRIDQLEAESQAMKQIALSGGGPDEQRAALDKYIAGRRGPPPVAATAQATPPPPPRRRSRPAPPVTPPDPPSPRAAPIAARAAGGRRPAGQKGQRSRRSPRSPSAAAGSRAAGGRVLCPDRRLLDRGQCREAARPDHQLRLDRDFPGVVGRPEVYRVRLGPYSTQEAAGIVADRLKRSGYGDARVVAD